MISRSGLTGEEKNGKRRTNCLHLPSEFSFYFDITRYILEVSIYHYPMLLVEGPKGKEGEDGHQ